MNTSESNAAKQLGSLIKHGSGAGNRFHLQRWRDCSGRTTHADGAVGVQISRPVGSIAVRRGIETFGGTGESLVKGVVMTLSAIGLSVKPGGSARSIEISGGITANGQGVPPIEVHGKVDLLHINDGISTNPDGFDRA